MFQRLGHAHQPQWSSTNSHVYLIRMYICTYYHSAIFTNDVTYIYESCLNGPPHAHQRQQSSTISTVCLMRMYICMCHHSAIFMNDITYVYESYHNDLDTLTNHSGLLQSALYHPRMEKSHSCWPRTADMEWLRLVGSLKIIGLFCKRALLKRRYSTKETYNFKEPTNRSHPICREMCFTTTELVQ